jgi:hypothetical protein
MLLLLLLLLIAPMLLLLLLLLARWRAPAAASPAGTRVHCNRVMELLPLY